MSNTNTIDVNRLNEYFPHKEEGIAWNDFDPITIESVEDGIKCGIQEQLDPYDLMQYTDIPNERDWHLGRIIYFVKNPDKITPISIDADVWDGRFTDGLTFFDGNHRFMAHLYLGHKNIECYYGGRCDILDYLTGDSNKKPTDWI